MPLPTHTLEPAPDAPSLPDFPHFPTDMLSLGSHLDRSSSLHTLMTSSSSIWGLHWIGTECHFKHAKLEPASDVPSLTALMRLTQYSDMLCSEPHVCPESPTGTTTPRRQRKNAIATTVSTPTEPPQKPRKSPAKSPESSLDPIPILPTISTRRVGVLDPSPSNIPESSRDARCKILPIYRRKNTQGKNTQGKNTLDDPRKIPGTPWRTPQNIFSTHESQLRHPIKGSPGKISFDENSPDPMNQQ